MTISTQRFLLLAAFLWLTIFAASPSVAETPRLILKADFSVDAPAKILDPADAAGAVLTSNPAEEANGKQSLKGDSRASAGEWNEFFHSRPGLFPTKEAYKIAFDYKILERSPSTRFYVLMRPITALGTSQVWGDWSADAGKSGHAEILFAPRSTGDSILILGIQHRGMASINNITITTDPAERLLTADLPQPIRTWTSPGGASYYADSQSGSDTNDGRSPQHAWRRLSRINSGVFGPGDRILLRAGGHWNGFLSPGGSGAAGKPIIVGRYGPGPKPALDAAGAFRAAVFLHNSEYWDIGNLDIANRAPGRISGLAGVQISLEEFGTAHGLRLHNLTIRDVFGSNVKSEGGGNGIYCTSGGSRVKTRYDGLVIENNSLARTDRNGITLGAYYPRPEWPLSTHVVIRGNLLEDIGGDGIVPIGCDGCRVAHNILRGGRMRVGDYAAGIWPWSCDNTVVEYNEVSGMHGELDGEGYDSDYNCRNSLFQYNFSHDNDGGFMLICDDGGQQMPQNIGNSGTVIRDNVSVNDGFHTFNITGPCRNTQIYNNVFYLGKRLNIPFVASDNWGGAWAGDTRFVNNIFYAAGQGRFELGGMTGTVFSHNSFWGGIASRPPDSNALLADPMLIAPGSSAPSGYGLLPLSPLRHSGLPIAGNGIHDFWGNPLSPAMAPDIGAGSSRKGD